MNLIFDLDNTIADFSGGGGLVRMNEEGFFAGLQAYRNSIETVRELTLQGYNVFILSACIDTAYCKLEKMEWIAKNLPFIPAENVILINVGESKRKEWERVKGRSISLFDVLFDDYKGNLVDWMESGGTAIKCGKQYKPHRRYFQMVRFERIYSIIRKVILNINSKYGLDLFVEGRE